ncbi:MAG: type II toxin-antitoxin system HicA family toxin [Chloroflexi bacterium]|nr:type II toxin-antitoxin system HicA family toxin [Chloroflexota bacterium]
MASKLPALRPARIIRALESCGLRIIRQRGSHVVLWKEGLARPVIIAQHTKELPPSVVSDLLRQADVAADEFLKHV